MRPSIRFKLTPEQIKKCAPLQRAANKAAIAGEPGIIIAQLGRTSPKGEHIVQAAFIENNFAWEIKNILARATKAL